jgi:hypothetical protein
MAGLSAGLCVLALALAYFHLGYKEVALALSMRGFPYASRESARAYLREIGQNITNGVSDEAGRVEAYIAWMRKNMQLQNNIRNHPNAAFLIERGGHCGEFTSVLMSLLRANGMSARQVLLNSDGKTTAHVIGEVKINGQWTAFDPLGFGGGAFPEDVFVSHVSDRGRGYNTLDLYRRPDRLPEKNKFGAPLFRTGSRFKVEVCADYGEFRVDPNFVYGRDWPMVTVSGAGHEAWVYGDPVQANLQDVVLWHAFPYFSRVTLWFGPRPVVFHFEWGVLGLALVGYALVRLRNKMGRAWVVRGAIGVASLLAVYVGAVILLWWDRYNL